MKIIDTTSWENFSAELDALRRHLESDENNVKELLFRGHANAKWGLRTTLERQTSPQVDFPRYYRIIQSIKPAIETLTNERWNIEDFGTVVKFATDHEYYSNALSLGRYPAYEYFAYLRHHGFPSPLLDWTRSVNIAAFFAFQNANPDENSEDKVSIYVLTERGVKAKSNYAPEVRRLGPNVRVHRRHVSQQSEYTMCLQFIPNGCLQFQPHDNNIDAKWAIDPSYANFILYKFNIPSKERRTVLKLLDEYNLNAFSLFGSEESLMETLAFRKFF